MKSGDILGPYRVQEKLGEGGMGQVYRAHDPRLKRDVAIKIIPGALARDPERLRRFEREAQILAALDHAHIARIHGIEELDGAFALVLEFIDGVTLADRIANGPVPLNEALTIARQIADALETAHEQGIIHRDLKPANVKIRPDGVVKVLDFGLARMDADTSAVRVDGPTISAVATRDGLVMGTAAYMSPEQAQGHAVDRRTDIWAFGCVLFEMLTGRRPFDADSTTGALAKILEREPDWSSVPADVPRPIRDLLQRCLRKDARQRLRDIGDARIAIEEIKSVDFGQESRRNDAVRPRRTSVVVMLAVAAIAATGALIGERLVRRLWAEPGPAQFVGFTRLVASPAHETAPVISPDGKWVAYLSNARGPVDVWVKFIGSGQAVNLTDKSDLAVQSQDVVGGLAVSPDGLQLAFSAGPPGALPGQLATWVIPAPVGGVPHRLVRGQGLQWSPDGKRIAYVLPGGASGDSIVVADADGQNERVVLQRQGGRHAHWINWSHDGEFVYFTSSFQNLNTAPIEIWKVPAAGGAAAEPVIPTARRAMFPTLDPAGRGLLFAANPDTVESGLWWRDFRTRVDHRITYGVGEYGASHLSSDGRRLIAVASTVQHALQRIAVRFDKPPALEPLTDGYSGDVDPSWSPDGTRIAFSSARSGNQKIWSARADLSQPFPLTTGTSLDERPAYSPDGREVAFVSDRDGRRGIWVVGAEGGAPRLIAEAHVLDYLSWSRDGRRIVYAEPGRDVPRLAVVDVATGKATPLPEGRAASSPAWSPTADVIAYAETQGGGRGAFLRFVTGDGRRHPLVDDSVTMISNGVVSWSPDGRRLAGIGLPGSRNGYIWIIEPGAVEPFRKLADLPADVRIRGVTWTRDGSSLVIGHVRSTGDIVLAERVR